MRCPLLIIFLTGLFNLDRMSCGHIDGVRAENGPPGVGMKSEPDVKFADDEMLSPSPQYISLSSSSSDNVSPVKLK